MAITRRAFVAAVSASPLVATARAAPSPATRFGESARFALHRVSSTPVGGTPCAVWNCFSASSVLGPH